jgi:hypothetical protein
MKRQLIAFARELDTFCGRMNDGLAAVAILLGFLVMTMSVIRAQDFMPEGLASVPADYSLAVGE